MYQFLIIAYLFTLNLRQVHIFIFNQFVANKQDRAEDLGDITCTDSGHIRQLNLELRALERSGHVIVFVLGRIDVKLAANKDRYKMNIWNCTALK